MYIVKKQYNKNKILVPTNSDYKFDQYTLKRVSTFFLGETKDPLTHKDIFRGYKLGMEDTEKGRFYFYKLKNFYFINDSKSTNFDSVKYAIKNYKNII
mgnify:CR=1 FL=1